jgi:hypothetical protein
LWDWQILHTAHLSPWLPVIAAISFQTANKLAIKNAFCNEVYPNTADRSAVIPRSRQARPNVEEFAPGILLKLRSGKGGCEGEDEQAATVAGGA